MTDRPDALAPIPDIVRAVMQEIADNHRTPVNVCPGLLAFGPIERALATERRRVAEQEATIATLRAELADRQRELNNIDAIIARRPTLTRPSRWQNVEHAIGVAAQADVYGRKLCDAERTVEQQAQEIATLRADLAYWKTCSNCHEQMDAPGHCSNAEAERKDGYMQMHEELCDARDKAESEAAALRAQVETLTQERDYFRDCSRSLDAARESLDALKSERDEARQEEARTLMNASKHQHAAEQRIARLTEALLKCANVDGYCILCGSRFGYRHSSLCLLDMVALTPEPPAHA